MVNDWMEPQPAVIRHQAAKRGNLSKHVNHIFAAWMTQ